MFGLLGTAAGFLGGSGGGLLKKAGSWLKNKGGDALGGMLGAGMMQQGAQQQNAANRPPSLGSLRGVFQNTQNMINSSTDWSNFSGKGADDSLQAGNDSVRTAAMMGQGGSAANAIRNRVKSATDNSTYEQFQQNKNAMIPHQMNIDNAVFGQNNANQTASNAYKTSRGQELYKTGRHMLGQMNNGQGMDYQKMMGTMQNGFGGLLQKAGNFLQPEQQQPYGPSGM